MDERASLGERLVEIRERLEQLVKEIDVRAQIEAHPWEIVAGAALVGAWLGYRSPAVKVGEPSTWRIRLGDAVLSALGALALRLVKDAVVGELAVIAKQWWEDSGSHHARAGDGAPAPA